MLRIVWSSKEGINKVETVFEKPGEPLVLKPRRDVKDAYLFAKIDDIVDFITTAREEGDLGEDIILYLPYGVDLSSSLSMLYLPLTTSFSQTLKEVRSRLICLVSEINNVEIPVNLISFYSRLYINLMNTDSYIESEHHKLLADRAAIAEGIKNYSEASENDVQKLTRNDFELLGMLGIILSTERIVKDNSFDYAMDLLTMILAYENKYIQPKNVMVKS